ncbi:MAG: DNA replication complex subunit Gins51 [Promethearchaeota archaeon]
MDDFKTLFEKLLVQWQYEINSNELFKITDDILRVFLQFQKDIHDLQHDSPPPDTDELTRKIIWEIKVEAAKIVDFLISDTLDLRQEKILNLCRKLETIDPDLMTSAEHDFYQNIMSAFKGYKKTRNLYNVIIDECAIEQSMEDLNGDEMTSENKMIEESLSVCKDTGETASPMVNTTKERQIQYDALKNIEYTLIKVLQNFEPIVGIDLITYGPFKKESIARIPKINARILEKEKFCKIL